LNVIGIKAYCGQHRDGLIYVFCYQRNLKVPWMFMDLLAVFVVEGVLENQTKRSVTNTRISWTITQHRNATLACLRSPCLQSVLTFHSDSI